MILNKMETLEKENVHSSVFPEVDKSLFTGDYWLNNSQQLN